MYMHISTLPGQAVAASVAAWIGTDSVVNGTERNASLQSTPQREVRPGVEDAPSAFAWRCSDGGLTGGQRGPNGRV